MKKETKGVKSAKSSWWKHFRSPKRILVILWQNSFRWMSSNRLMFNMISKSSTSQRRLEHDAMHDCVTCLRNYKICDLTCLVNYEGHVSFLKALQWIHLEAIVCHACALQILLNNKLENADWSSHLHLVLVQSLVFSFQKYFLAGLGLRQWQFAWLCTGYVPCGFPVSVFVSG